MRVEREGERSGSLLEGRVARGIGARGANGGFVEIGQIVADVAVVVGAVLKAEILAQVMCAGEVETEFETVAALGPGNGVSKLVAALVGERWPLQERRDTHVEPVGDEDVRRQA